MLLAGLCALALVAVGLAWSLASPAGSSPDDDFHLASIWCATGDPAVCRRTGEEIEEGVERVHVLPDLGEGLDLLRACAEGFRGVPDGGSPE